MFNKRPSATIVSISLTFIRGRVGALPHSIVERAVEILPDQVPVGASLYDPLVGKGIRNICEDASLA